MGIINVNISLCFTFLNIAGDYKSVVMTNLSNFKCSIFWLSSVVKPTYLTQSSVSGL